jgi:hypothetical protein
MSLAGMNMGVLPSRTPRISSPLLGCPFLHIPEVITTYLTARGLYQRLRGRGVGAQVPLDQVFSVTVSQESVVDVVLV